MELNEINKEQYRINFEQGWHEQTMIIRNTLTSMIYKHPDLELQIKAVINFYNFIERYIETLELDNIELLIIRDKLKDEIRIRRKMINSPGHDMFYEINEMAKKVFDSAEKTFDNGHSRN